VTKSCKINTHTHTPENAEDDDCWAQYTDA